MQLRSFAWSDLEAVLDLWRAAGPGIHLGRSDSPEEIRKKLSRDPDLFLVAEDQGRIIGAVMGGYDGRRGLVYHLAVLPERRRRGLGSTLMAELEQRLRAKGCVKYYLLVTPDNPQVLEFYRELGWSVMDMTLMGKELM
jgi:ribosomal protein S18 acetylase RimI-like enzyme